MTTEVQDTPVELPVAIRAANEHKANQLRRELELLIFQYRQAARMGGIRKLADVADDISRVLTANEPVRTFVKFPDEPAYRF